VSPDLRRQILLWKSDLSKAFTLLNFHSTNVHLLACALTDGYTLIYHTGLFGWTGAPYAFDVITRLIRSSVRQCDIRGVLDMSVDDLIGATLPPQIGQTSSTAFTQDTSLSDRTTAKIMCINLLGSKAIAEHKDEQGRRLDIIGWTIDLDRRTVTLSRKNFLKTLFCFFSVDPEVPVSFRTTQRLASLSSRYTLVLRHMRPYHNFIIQCINRYKES
jgi:hypothetical protein